MAELIDSLDHSLRVVRLSMAKDMLLEVRVGIIGAKIDIFVTIRFFPLVLVAFRVGHNIKL